MKKIYWWIQQINRIGGTEMVTINLANELSKYFDITIISTVKTDGEIPYKMDENLKLMSLGIPKRCEQYDFYSHKYLSKGRIFSYLFLVIQIFFYYVLRRGHYRRLLQKKLLSEDATLICSSIDTYLLAPKKGRVYFHYHFSPDTFFGRDKFLRKLSRKPDKYIFLSESTLKEIIQKDSSLNGHATYIYNPIRFDSVLDTSFNNNTITFVGRLSPEKGPFLALKIVEELKKRNFKFNFKMFGYGPLEEDVKKYIKDNNLENDVELHGYSSSIQDELLKSDLLLITSKYEGFGLALVEANAMSTPVITTNCSPSFLEILSVGKNGIIVDSESPSDFADEIIGLLNNKEKLKQMKEDSYKESLKLGKDKIIPKWIELLSSKE